MLLLLLVVACHGAAATNDTASSEESCDRRAAAAGPSQYTCTYAYDHDTGTDEGTLAPVEVTCTEYLGGGIQIVTGAKDSCEQAGRDAGASDATCECTWTSVDDACPLECGGDD